MSNVVEEALKRGQKTLSEYESKLLLKEYGIPVTREYLAGSAKDAVKYAKELGYPVVLKGCGAELTHKTEHGLIKLGLKNEDEVKKAYEELVKKGSPMDGVLVQEMVEGDRELVIGLIRDPQFGPCVMFGLGGIYTEVLRDVSFRVAPLMRRDAREMMEEIKARQILGPFRGKEPVDREILSESLIAMGQIGLDHSKIKEIDINPLIILRGKPIAVDALVVLE